MTRSTRLTVMATFIVLTTALAAPALFGQSLEDERELVVKERYDHVVVIRTGRDREIDFEFRDVIVEELGRINEYEGNVAFVIEIDSPGGRVDAARDVVETIRGYRESEDLRIFAYVPRTAISAAAWIAFACRGLLIHPDATIGDIQPIIMNGVGFTPAPGKIVTALAEEIVVTCRSNGIEPAYPDLLMQAMVDADLEIVAVYNDKLGTPPRFMRSEDFNSLPSEDRRGLRPEVLGLPGKALTTNGRDLLDLGYAVKIVEREEDLLDVVGTPGAEWVVRDRSRRRSPLGIDLDWSIILLVLGVVLIILEFNAPGIGVFGLGGVACLIAFFLIQAGSFGDAMWPIVFLLVGAFFIVVEVLLLPGTVFPGLIGLALCLWATWLGVARPDGPFVIPDLGNGDDRAALQLWGGVLIGSIVGGVGIGWAFGKVLHRVPLLGIMVLRPPTGLAGPEGVEAGAASPARGARVTVGSTGKASTDLRTSGVAVIDGRRIDVVTRGTFIGAGSEIEVVEVAGNRVVVKQPARRGDTA